MCVFFDTPLYFFQKTRTIKRERMHNTPRVDNCTNWSGTFDFAVHAIYRTSQEPDEPTKIVNDTGKITIERVLGGTPADYNVIFTYKGLPPFVTVANAFTDCASGQRTMNGIHPSDLGSGNYIFYATGRRGNDDVSKFKIHGRHGKSIYGEDAVVYRGKAKRL